MSPPLIRTNYRFRPFLWLAAGLSIASSVLFGAETELLGTLSLEDLMHESVTSVSRKETKLGEASTAITVITQEDIRRTGHTSLPELLRLVPGLQVARVHGNEWAVSARGFNDQYANKLLVLMDGRTVYTPMFAGVYWNVQDAILPDVERVEVIRGPGATLWGANAVNGVINLTSKTAKETQGSLVAASFGREERPATSVRHGGKLGPNLFYRVYAKYFDRDGFVDQPGQDGVDSWDALRLGTRLDWEPVQRDLITLQAEYYRGTMGERFIGTSLAPPFTVPQNLVHHNFGGHVLGRWTRQLAPGSNVSLQTYYDRFHHGDGDIAETRDTADLEVQHRLPAGTRHDLVWGFGYRYTKDRLSPTFYLTFTPEREHEEFYGLFVQDEITLVPNRWKVTVGSKFDHNDATGWEVQPGIRTVWMPTTRQALWASISRAVRTPSRYDRHARLNTGAFQPPGSPPFLVSLLSHPDAGVEKLTAYEAGYRVEAGPGLSFDFAAFANDYDGILGYVGGPVEFENDPAPPHLLLPLNFRNRIGGQSYGTEASVQWRVTDRWKLLASHSWLHLRLHPDESQEQQSPTHQLQLRSYVDLPRNFQLDTAAYYVDRILSSLDDAPVTIPSYVRVDVGLTWRPTAALEVGAWARNLLDARHPEFGSFKTNTLTEVPRSIVGKLLWRF